MEYIKHITLDVNAEDNGRFIAVKQGDKILRKLLITLVADGLPYTPPDVAKAEFRCAKPDGNGVILDSTDTPPHVIAEDNEYTIELTDQTLIVAGRALCDLALYDSAGNILSSCPFVLDIIPMPNVASGILSTSEWERLLEAIEEAESIVGSNIKFRVEGSDYQYSTDGGETWETLTQFIAITNAQIDALF